MGRRSDDEVFRLKIEAAGPSAVSLRQLARILESTARLIEQAAAQAGIDVPRLFLSNVATSSAAPVIRAVDPASAKPLGRELTRIAKTRAHDEAPAVARAYEDLLEATAPVGPARFVPRGAKKGIELLPAAPPKLSIEVADEIHVRVVGLVVTRQRGTEVRLRRLTGGAETEEAFFTHEEEIAHQALTLFDKTAIAHVSYRNVRGALRPADLERLEPWTERPLLDVVDEVRAKMAADGVEIDAEEWIRELRS